MILCDALILSEDLFQHTWKILEKFRIFKCSNLEDLEVRTNYTSYYTTGHILH